MIIKGVSCMIIKRVSCKINMTEDTKLIKQNININKDRINNGKGMNVKKENKVIS